MSPTQRSLKHMRDQGYFAEVVERWVPRVNIRKDFAGFADILCIHRENKGDIVAVQSTSDSNVSARVKKITEHENLAVVRKGGFKILVHGWRKKGGRYVLREVDLS